MEPNERAMQLVAWGVLVIAFGVWIVLAIAGVRWASTFLQTAAAPAPSTLERVAGIVLYREAAQPTESSARQGMRVYEQDEIGTSGGSSAVLRTFDGAAFEVFPDARLQVNASRIGRFNPAATRAVFTLAAGAVRLTVPNMANKAHTVNVLTPHGAAAFVPGEYTLRVGPEGTRISVWQGRSAAAIEDQIVEIEDGEKITLHPDRKTYAVTAVLENALRNGDFSNGTEDWQVWEDGEPERPDVPGRRAVVPGEGTGAPRQVLRVSRTSVVDAHNETGLTQTVNRDVSGSRQVVIAARFRVDLASLSGGGYSGSEYPLMVRVHYRDNRGADRIWVQGFYYSNPENRPVRDGQRVERGVWTDFSFDLTQLGTPPALVEAVQVFGAGHTFDAMMGDVRLLVD